MKKTSKEAIFTFLRQISYTKLFKKYTSGDFSFNKITLNNLVFNESCLVVAKFKDFLIYDDKTEFLKRFYPSKESHPKLNKILTFYEKYSKIFPNYLVLKENTYLYRNIRKKQKMIDAINEIEREEKENKKKMKANKGIFGDKNKNLKGTNELFTRKIKDEIRTFQKNISYQNYKNSFDNDKNSEDTLLINQNSISISILNWKQYEKKSKLNEESNNNIGTNIDSFITNKTNGEISCIINTLNDNKIYSKDLPLIIMENKGKNTKNQIKKDKMRNLPMKTYLDKELRSKNVKTFHKQDKNIYKKISQNVVNTSGSSLAKRFKNKIKKFENYRKASSKFTPKTRNLSNTKTSNGKSKNSKFKKRINYRHISQDFCSNIISKKINNKNVINTEKNSENKMKKFLTENNPHLITKEGKDNVLGKEKVYVNVRDIIDYKHKNKIYNTAKKEYINKNVIMNFSKTKSNIHKSTRYFKELNDLTQKKCDNLKYNNNPLNKEVKSKTKTVFLKKKYKSLLSKNNAKILEKFNTHNNSMKTQKILSNIRKIGEIYEINEDVTQKKREKFKKESVSNHLNKLKYKCKGMVNSAKRIIDNGGKQKYQTFSEKKKNKSNTKNNSGKNILSKNIMTRIKGLSKDKIKTNLYKRGNKFRKELTPNMKSKTINLYKNLSQKKLKTEENVKRDYGTKVEIKVNRIKNFGQSNKKKNKIKF